MLIGLAFALAGCGVETGAPLSLPVGPGLVSMGTGSVVCPPPTADCSGADLGRCCLNPVDCSYKRCVFDGQVCRDDRCFARCNVDADCASVPGGDSTVELTCDAEKLCVPRSCTSNRGCDAGQVCQGAEDAGTCVPVSEAEPDPGCSAPAAPPASGTLAPAVSGLLLLGALAWARRRRTAQNE